MSEHETETKAEYQIAYEEAWRLQQEEGLSYREIGQRLGGRTPAQVGRLLRYARLRQLADQRGVSVESLYRTTGEHRAMLGMSPPGRPTKSEHSNQVAPVVDPEVATSLREWAERLRGGGR